MDYRHPVVEKVLKDALFVPNDTRMDGGENLLSIITGPNMAGKSTYMRQVALICLMAQIGSFVPAKSAHIGVVDGCSPASAPAMTWRRASPPSWWR